MIGVVRFGLRVSRKEGLNYELNIFMYADAKILTTVSTLQLGYLPELRIQIPILQITSYYADQPE